MRYNKLVRDKVPETIEKDSRTAVTRTASESEYCEKLREKLLEETQELLEETQEFLQNDRTEEFADVLEVIHAICSLKKIRRRLRNELGALALCSNCQLWLRPSFGKREGGD